MLYDSLEGWSEMGGVLKREVTYVLIHLWLIHVDVWQRPIQYCKAIILQLKNERKRVVSSAKICPAQVTGGPISLLKKILLHTIKMNPPSV